MNHPVVAFLMILVCLQGICQVRADQSVDWRQEMDEKLDKMKVLLRNEIDQNFFVQVLAMQANYNEIQQLKKANENEIQPIKKANENEIQQTKESTQINTNTKILFTAVTTKRMSVAAGQTVVLDTIYANIGGDYNEKTGEFVCSTPGYYLFSFGALLNVVAKFSFLTMYHNSKTALTVYGLNSGTEDHLFNSGILTLAKGDVVKVVARQASSFYNNNDDVYSTFSGHLLAPI